MANLEIAHKKGSIIIQDYIINRIDGNEVVETVLISSSIMGFNCDQESAKLIIDHLKETFNI